MSEKHASLLNNSLPLIFTSFRPACTLSWHSYYSSISVQSFSLSTTLYAVQRSHDFMTLLYSILCGVPSAMAVLLCRLAKSWGKWTVRTHAAASLLAECTYHSIATCKWSRSMPDDEVIRRLWRASCSDRILANDGQHQFIPKSANTMSFLASCNTQPLFQYSCIGDADFQ